MESIPYWDWNGHDHQWNENFAKYVDYLKSASSHELETRTIRDNRISTWLANQRADKRLGNLDTRKIIQLESVPEWTWLPLNDLMHWRKNFNILKNYADENGTSRVSKTLVINEVNVWQWINYQRTRNRRNELHDWQISELESLKDWEWNPSKKNHK